MNRDQDVSEGEEPIVSQDENIESEVDVEDSGAEKEANEVEQEPQLSVEELTQQLVVAKEEAAGNWDKALRIQAEMENVKRRSQKDIESAHKFALVGFAKELLTVVDSLELGLQAVTDSPEMVKISEGNALTLKQFLSVFSKFNIETIDPVGEKFNPEQHQAISMQESPDVEPNTVVTVFQKGYLLNGRILRPAMVIVAKAPSAEVEKNEENDDS
ncbi:MAG: nucleotide exchange factor GrpE [Methylococcales bacterium]|jgi:molecular chaperone GrpE|nr:nucleotide exchange factor GrpE [Methylococcaceae bacterium]HIL40664.1 nucleotide exchange factor GrpE [Methylococcales bacterium]